MSPTTKPAKNPATEKARKAAIGEIQQRLDGPLADAPASAAVAAPDAEVVAVAGSPRPPKATKAKGKKAPAAKPVGKPATKPAAAKPPAKPAAKPTKAGKADAPKKLSALSAAAQVLAASKEPLNAKTIVEQMATQGLWTSPGGKTPDATLSAAMQRDIAAKGRDSRFKKVDRGMYAATGR